MKYRIKDTDLKQTLRLFDSLSHLLTERVTDLYDCKGGVHYRQLFTMYRNKAMDAKHSLRDNVKKSKSGHSTITNAKVNEVAITIDELKKLLTERISDMDGEQGYMQAIHSYRFYLSKADAINEKLFDGLIEIEK